MSEAFRQKKFALFSQKIEWFKTLPIIIAH